MKYKKIKLTTIFFIFVILLNIILFSNKVEAASFSVSASKSSVTVGDSFDITINGKGLTGKYNITGNSNVTINGDTNPWIENTSVTINCTTKGEGIATVTVTPVTVADASTGEDLNLSAKTVNVTVKAKEVTPDPEPPTTTKSTEARLRDLGITPNDFKGFKRDTTTYNVEVPNNVSKVNVYAKAVDSNAKISGTGNVSLKEGTNTVTVTVTAEAGNTKTYTLNITRKTSSTTDEPDETANKSSEARLSNLGIRPKEYDFSGFKRDTMSYSVEVPNDIEEVEVYAEAVSSKAKITGTGNISLKEGKNTVEVKVTAEDGTEKTYKLEITRTASTIEEPEPTVKEENELALSSLLIKNITLNPKFDPSIYEYKIDLTEDKSSLDIEAKSNNSDAIIEIIGNQELKDGENVITILVSNSETEETATYQIIVNKNVSKSEIVGRVDWTKPSTWGLKEKILIGVAIALIVIIIVATIIKIKLANREDDDFDLPGAEELDRALAEHQELAEEDDDMQQSYTQEKAVSHTYTDDNFEEERPKTDIEKAQEYFESYSKRRGKHF